VIVHLTKDEVRVCTLLAVERWLTKFGSVDRPAKAYNLQWSVPWYPNELHKDRKDIPDVGNVEIRTVRTRDSIPFWKKDINKTIFGVKVLDEEYYSSVQIYGSFNANDYMRAEYTDTQIDGWRVPVSEIK